MAFAGASIVSLPTIPLINHHPNNTPLSPNNFIFSNDNSEDGDKDPGYKWRLLIAYDGTRYSGPLLQLEVEGSGFLYRQVRNMAALLLQIGREGIPPDVVPKILASRDRKELAKYALSAPPHGLHLVNIKKNIYGF